MPGRLKAVDLGLVINEDDPYSVKVGEHYIKARKIPEANVLRVRLPVKPSLSRAEFEVAVKSINDHFGDKIQALALAWRMPYAVECNGLTGALAMGFDAKLCQQTCAASRPSRYYGGYSSRPYRDTGMRLAMQLAAKDVEQAQRMIDRGVSSDGTLGLRGAPLVNVHMVTTSDK
ncbi:MAG: TIGR03790 family protein, partial [Aquabacterium sp.]